MDGLVIMAEPSEVIAHIERAIAPESMVVPMREVMLIVINEQMAFPPQPDRMRSGHLNTWVREVGRLPASAFIKTVVTRQGTWTGARKRIKRTPNDILKPSEKMLEKWKNAPIRIGLTGAGALMGEATNAASYSGWVQGVDQTDFHKATGWLDNIGAFNKHADRAVRKFVDKIVADIEGR